MVFRLHLRPTLPLPCCLCCLLLGFQAFPKGFLLSRWQVALCRKLPLIGVSPASATNFAASWLPLLPLLGFLAFPEGFLLSWWQVTLCRGLPLIPVSPASAPYFVPSRWPVTLCRGLPLIAVSLASAPYCAPSPWQVTLCRGLLLIAVLTARPTLPLPGGKSPSAAGCRLLLFSLASRDQQFGTSG